MSEDGNDAIAKPTKGITTLHTYATLILEVVKAKTLEDKLDAKALEPSNNNEAKYNVEQTFGTKQIGRPSADSDTKRQTCCEMPDQDQFRTPKPITLEYYEITKEEDKHVYL